VLSNNEDVPWLKRQFVGKRSVDVYKSALGRKLARWALFTRNHLS
jgi:hypothetical protein